MKLRSLIITLLIGLLCVGAIFWYYDHICVTDRIKIEEIISGDARFNGIKVKRLWNELFLEGNVASTDDLNLFFQKVNEIKRGRAVSRITVQSIQTNDKINGNK